MKRRLIAWVVAIIVTALLSWAVARSTTLPGDVAITRILQSIGPQDDSWAEAGATSAKTPWNFILLAVTVILSWLIAGWRAAVFAALCFLVLLAPGPWLQTVME